MLRMPRMRRGPAPASAGEPAGADRDQAPPRGLRAQAWFAGGLLAIVWGWWAWQDGAYFGVVLLPGTILLCAGAARLAGLAPRRLGLGDSPAVAIALSCLVGLGLWSLASAVWSPAPDIAIGDAQRILAYALAFGLGLWLAASLGSRLELAAAPLAAAAAFAGVGVVVALATGEPRDVLEVDGTLDFPLGYRNANAAFFAIAIFPAVGLAAASSLDWRLRGLALGTATTCVNCLLASQSRASLPALGIALAIFLLASPVRLRSLAWLALAALPAAVFVPAAAELYSEVGSEGLRNVSSQMHSAGLVAAIAGIAAAAVGALCARNERRLPALGATGSGGNRAVLAAMATALVLAAVAFVGAVGNPVSWVEDRVNEFKTAGTPDLSSESSRFTFNVGSGRYDLWRVAVDDFAADPLRGDGGGGFQYSYTRHRDTPYADVRDAHSVEFELLSELGLPGIALFVAALVAIAIAIAGARRRGPPAAALAAVALASGTYWLVHSSVDWFWPYPAVTAPVLALLGAACAPALAPRPGRSRAPRLLLVGGLALLALSAIPPFLSERYVNNAYATWRDDVERAYDDLERAADLNPFSDAPLLAEGAIARERGDRERAIRSFTAAADKRPEEWAAHYLLAEQLAASDRAAARARIRIALELNPLNFRVRALGKRLGVDPRPAA